MATEREESRTREALACSAALADYAETALLKSADADSGLRWMVGQFAMRLLLGGASDPPEDGSDFAMESRTALAARAATVVLAAGACDPDGLSLEGAAMATQAQIVRLLLASAEPVGTQGELGLQELETAQVAHRQILPPLLGEYAPACVAQCEGWAGDGEAVIALLWKAGEAKEGGQAQMRQWLSSALRVEGGGGDVLARRAALIVVCHRLREPLRLGLGTAQRRLYESMLLLADTFASSDPQDLQTWQGVAEAILSHHLDRLLPAPAPRGSQRSAASPRAGLLDPMPHDVERGGGVLGLLRALLGHSCPGRLSGGALISPDQATRQLVAFERTLAACTLEAQLWLLPALLRPGSDETPSEKSSEEGAGGALTLGAAIVVQRLLLRAVMAAVRQIKQAPEYQTVLDERVRALKSMISYCLAAGAQGGLGGEDSGGSGENFDCAGFVRGADMIVGALSLLRLVMGYECWCETQLGSSGAGAAAAARRVARQAVVQGGGSSGSSSVAMVEDVLWPLRLRVETYLAALSRLEGQMHTDHDAPDGGESGSIAARLGIVGGGGGEGQKEGISQACTTLQMLLQALEAASDQLLQSK